MLHSGVKSTFGGMPLVSVSLQVKGLLLPGRDQLVRFNEGGILESDPWRITHLELLILGEQGDEATSNPSSVLQTANEYAVTGFRILAEQLRGVIDPQTHLMGEIVRQAER